MLFKNSTSRWGSGSESMYVGLLYFLLCVDCVRFDFVLFLLLVDFDVCLLVFDLLFFDLLVFNLLFFDLLFVLYLVFLLLDLFDLNLNLLDL